MLKTCHFTVRSFFHLKTNNLDLPVSVTVFHLWRGGKLHESVAAMPCLIYQMPNLTTVARMKLWWGTLGNFQDAGMGLNLVRLGNRLFQIRAYTGGWYLMRWLVSGQAFLKGIVEPQLYWHQKCQIVMERNICLTSSVIWVSWRDSKMMATTNSPWGLAGVTRRTLWAASSWCCCASKLIGRPPEARAGDLRLLLLLLNLITIRN